MYPKNRKSPHGHTSREHGHSPTYTSWQDMIARCTKPNNPEYHNYGGRGISVHPSFMTFIPFLSHIGERPAGLTLERIDNNGNYEPGNVRWATMAEQRRNCRRNRFITYNGETKVLEDWSSALGIAPNTLAKRLRKWPIDRALSSGKTPLGWKRLFTDAQVADIRNSSEPAIPLSKTLGVDPSTINRIRRGMYYKDTY